MKIGEEKLASGSPAGQIELRGGRTGLRMQETLESRSRHDGGSADARSQSHPASIDDRAAT